jgi:hypothetical protein
MILKCISEKEVIAMRTGVNSLRLSYTEKSPDWLRIEAVVSYAKPTALFDLSSFVVGPQYPRIKEQNMLCSFQM